MEIRELTASEFQHIATTLSELREHFKVWPTDSGNEWHLVDFAYYEGCGHQEHCRETLRIAAPLALGNHLVKNYRFDWRMIKQDAEWRYAVAHAALDAPIDLYDLDDNPLLDPDEHDDDTEPFDPGEGAHESLHAILRKLTERGR